ncbi:aspartic peptidase domain-containing protein [Podospora fimiseda]|uniref:Aspartic peptidase domain-containing protein n=1 Tax=Podospora fimiseda TaxID=252190 RepID=A0AAN7BUJ4_9PEZI|nr:aspartic peptidase domain-containing protein [Podospora fimiseda]
MSSKLLSLLTVLPAAVLASTDGAVYANGIVRYDITPKRDGSLYTIPLKLGTPGQSVPFKIDTGKSETWANPRCTSSVDPAFCQTQQRFTMSSTLIDLGVQGSALTREGISDGYVSFQYVADYVGVGQARITQQIFGVSYDSTAAVVSTLGLGPDLNGFTASYPLFLDNMVNQGLINSRAFSLDLKSFGGSGGSIIFGGVDTKKFQGELVKLPIIPGSQTPDATTRYWVYVNEISVSKEDGSVANAYETPEGGRGQPVYIDSGSAFSTLPGSIVNNIIAAFPSAVLNEPSGLYQVDCEGPEDVSVDFTFMDTTISVPYKDFIYNTGNICFLGVKEGDNSKAALGANFLRAAYVVFDQNNRNIHLAQTGDCGSELVPIEAGADGIPSVNGCAVPVTTTEASSTTTTEATSTETEATTTTTTTAESTTETTEAATTESDTETTEATTTESATETTESATTTEAPTATETDSDDECEETETASETVTESATESATESSTDVIPTITATDAPVTTTDSPITTTDSPITTTDSPITTTDSPITTTDSPITTTAEPTSDVDRTITYTSVYTATITSCAPTVTNCPNRPRVSVITQVITATTSVCPETTGAYTLTVPGTSGSSKVVTLTLTPHPVVPNPTPTPITVCPGGCGNGGGGVPQPSQPAGHTVPAIPSHPVEPVQPPHESHPSVPGQPPHGSNPSGPGQPPHESHPSPPGNPIHPAPATPTTLIPNPVPHPSHGHGGGSPSPTGSLGGGHHNGTVPAKPVVSGPVEVNAAGRVAGLSGLASGLLAVVVLAVGFIIHLFQISTLITLLPLIALALPSINATHGLKWTGVAIPSQPEITLHGYLDEITSQILSINSNYSPSTLNTTSLSSLGSGEEVTCRAMATGYRSQITKQQ